MGGGGVAGEYWYESRIWYYVLNLRYLLSVEIEIFSKHFRGEVWVEDRNLAIVTRRVDVKKEVQAMSPGALQN